MSSSHLTPRWSKPDSNLRSRVTRPTLKAAVCHLRRLPNFAPTEESARTKGSRSNYAGPEKARDPKMCEVAHTSNRIGKAIRGTALRSLGSVGDTEGAMPRYDLWWCRILSRIELDQRSRVLQLERIEWLLIPPAAGKRRLFGGGRGGGESSQTGRIRRLLRARSSPVPPIVETRRLEMALAQVSPKPSYAIGP